MKDDILFVAKLGSAPWQRYRFSCREHPAVEYVAFPTIVVHLTVQHSMTKPEAHALTRRCMKKITIMP